METELLGQRFTGHEIKFSPEISDLVTACKDLHEACLESDTRHLIVGSVAAVCAVGSLYRIPGDVDSWYDIKKTEELRRILEQRGYSRRVVEAPGAPFPYPLEHYEKGKKYY